MLFFDNRDSQAVDDALAKFRSGETIHNCGQCNINRATKYRIYQFRRETALSFRCQPCVAKEKPLAPVAVVTQRPVISG